jgi:hypothetical protein
MCACSVHAPSELGIREDAFFTYRFEKMMTSLEPLSG